MDKCPKCNTDLEAEFTEQQTVAGDYVNEYRITSCFNEQRDFKQEECIGGHCDESWNIEGN